MITSNFKSVNFLAILCFSFLLYSCSEDSEVIVIEEMEEMEPTPSMPMMSAIIDGEPWSTDYPAAIIHNNFINIGGEATSSERIEIVFNGLTEGSYSFNPEEGNVLGYLACRGGCSTYTNTQNTISSNFGNAVITEIDRVNQTISGTFESEVHLFVIDEVKVITEGRFKNIPIIRDYSGPKADEFYTEIGGVPFHAVYTSAFVSSFDEALTVSADAALKGEGFEFRLPNNIEVGTYDLGAPYQSEYGVDYNSVFGNGFFPARSGKITILEHDLTSKFLKAEFYFNTENHDDTEILEIREGAFQVNY